MKENVVALFGTWASETKAKGRESWRQCIEEAEA
jgi:hypothetical protein